MVVSLQNVEISRGVNSFARVCISYESRSKAEAFVKHNTSAPEGHKHHQVAVSAALPH